MRVVISLIDKADFTKVSGTSVIEFGVVGSSTVFRSKNICTIMDQDFEDTMGTLPEVLGYLAYTNRKYAYVFEREIIKHIKGLVEVVFDHDKTFYAKEEDYNKMVEAAVTTGVCSLTAYDSTTFNSIVSSIVEMYETLCCEDAYGDYEYDLMKSRLSDDVKAFIRSLQG